MAAGPGLVFEVIPAALALMPAPVLVSLMFFLMLVMLGLTSAVPPRPASHHVAGSRPAAGPSG